MAIPPCIPQPLSCCFHDQFSAGRAGEGGTEFYLHSNLCAETEGEQLARSWYRPEQERYIVYGMGLGYAVQALLSDGPAAIKNTLFPLNSGRSSSASAS